MSHLSYNTLRSLATRALGHGVDKGGDKGGNGFSKMPINRDFVRGKGGDERFLATSHYFSITCLCCSILVPYCG